MYDTDLVVLTGAGVSIPVGIPGMKGMARRFQSDLPAGSDAAKGLRLLRDFGAASDLEELLELANGISGFSDGELDAFVDSCVGKGKASTSRLRDYHRQRNLVIERVRAFQRELLEWLKRACLNYDKEKAIALYGPLVRALAQFEVPVFTTNYDGVWEHVARSQEISVVDNFVRRGSRQFWDKSLGSYQQDGLRIVKLHGSVYWHASKDGRIEKLDPPSSVNSDGHPVERLVIVPTRFKDIYRQNYFPLYTSFLRTLGQSRVCVVIGHSLRDEYLSAAVRDRLRDPEFRVVIIDPNLRIPADIVEGAVKAESQLVHVKAGAEELWEVYASMFGAASVEEGISVCRTLADTVSGDTKTELEVLDFPQWLEAGGKNSLHVRMATKLSAARLEGEVRPSKKRAHAIRLDTEIARAWKGAPEIGPLDTLDRRIAVYMRKTMGRGPHRLVVRLVSQDGRTLAEATKDFRLKGI